MATLQSPGVSVSVIDESFYTPAGAGTVPMFFVATAEDKANGAGSGTAQGTTAANAGKVWVITSQRDLTDTFGTPYFETDAEGNPVHAGELNEYGLQAAYSALGVSSKAYIIRADVDTSQLVADGSVPGGTPVNGTYWINPENSAFGINEWSTSTSKFTVKTPYIIDNTNVDNDYDMSTHKPVTALPVSAGTYAMLLISDNGNGDVGDEPNQLFYKSASSGWLAVNDGFDGGKTVTLSPHYDYPDFSSADDGSVWVKTTSPSRGSNWDVKVYSAATKSWNTVSAPLYNSTDSAIDALDDTGGKAIPLGSVFVEYDPTQDDKAIFQPWIRYKGGATSITASSSHMSSGIAAFTMRETLKGGGWNTITINLTSGGGTVPMGQKIAEGINESAFVNVLATWDSAQSRLTITHALGGDIQVNQTTNQPFTDVFGAPAAGDVANLYKCYDGAFEFLVTNWKPLVYESQSTAPTTAPDDGQVWYSSELDVDIMYNNGTIWQGYLNAFPDSDPLGPMVSASMPTTQQDGLTALAFGDVWISTDNPDQYGRSIYVYDGSQYVLQDVTDSDSPDGWVFNDARWADGGDKEDADTIVELLSSDYVDPDAPNPRLYPRGVRLFNTRRSGNNIKKYHKGYINTTELNERFGDESMAGYFADRWVTASPNAVDGAGQFGRQAQRSVVVKALKAEVTSNQAIRDTDTLVFNLIACPGYPELMQNMVEFNVDIGQTAHIVADTPFRLPATGTALSEYGNNTVLAADNNDTAAVTYDVNLSMFYPSGYTNDNLGNAIVVPPSHMMIRTILNNDNKAYLWFAPAGTRRGTIDNASSVGFVDAESGEFKTASLHQGLRDVMAGVKINPIATLPGVGLVNMGQYTRAQNASALDRINVSRLIAHLRRQLSILAKPFLFEPNDAQTRHEVKSAVDALLTELVGQRALYDFLVVCDKTNNTPARIDRSELWIDIAIEPVKAVEFIYIPLRILNTGGVAALSN